MVATLSMALLELLISVAKCEQTKHLQSCSGCTSKAPGIVPTKRPKSQKVGVAFDVPSDERFMVRACVLAECRFKPGPQTAQLKFCWSQLQGKALIIAHNVWARGAAMIPIRFWNPYTRPGCGYFRFDCTCPQECCWEGK